MRDSFIRDSFTEATLLSVTGPVAASPEVHKQWRRLLRRATKPDHACAKWRLCLLDHCMRLEHILFWITQHETGLQDSHSQLNNKSMTGTPMLHVEASFSPAERGLRPEILSQTSLKHHISFGSFPQFSFANN